MPTHFLTSSNRLRSPSALQQRGVSLIELMVGIAIGLLTVAVAMGALMTSRSITATVGDASQLQQQSAYAFRILAQQLRQAGSMRLNLAPLKSEGATIEISDPVAFETKAIGFNPNADILQGIDTPEDDEFHLTVGYRNYTEQLHIAPGTTSLLRNCLGESGSNTRIQSRFVFRDNTLLCAGENTPQPIVERVANFQVRYLMQTTPHGNPNMQYVNATTVGDQWHRVYAVEVCLVLFGNEAIDMPVGSNYMDCPAANGSISPIDMTTLPPPRNRRLHKIYRTVFQLRSQGLLQASY